MPLIENKSIIGVVSESSKVVVGFCNGDVSTGEALLLDHEGLELGKRMLSLVTDKQSALGLKKL